MTQPGKSGLSRTWIVAAVAAALILVIVLVALSATGDSTGKAPDALVGVDEAIELVDGIPQSGRTLGKPDAPVTIREFADLQCPYCADAAATALPTIVRQFVKTGQAKLVYEPLTFIGDDSVRGARAAVAAGEQGKLWQFAEVLFRNQGEENGGWLSDAMVAKAAEAVGLDTAKLDDAKGGSAVDKALDEAQSAATAENVNSTPTFLVRGPKGQVTIQQYANIAEFEAAIAAVR